MNHVVGAAQAIEAASFDPTSLDRVARREDALGRLARVFQRMAREVYLREQRLRQQLEQLRLDMEEMKRAQSEPLTIYMPMDRCQALARGETLPDRVTGAALFADISGFTPLTGALAQELGLERGAEELTRTVSQVYTALIDEVHRYGGSVIGFAGDAITCWFDDITAQRAVACALAMQEAMALCNTVTTPGGTTFPLAAKVAVVAGPVRRLLVGDPEIQVIEAIAGQTLDRLAAAEHVANRGEVVVQAEVAEQLAGYLAIRERRVDDRGRPIAVISGSVEGVTPAPPLCAPSAWPEVPPESLSDVQCRPWVLPEVYERSRSGHKQFLSELRPVSALFINFKGIDYDADEEAGVKLDAYVRWVQRVAERYEAIFDHLTMGDKGSYICLAFGAPIAHSDDETRSVWAALELLSPPPELAFIGSIRIGVAAGQALVGTYGGRGRRTYGIQGDRVNLAARLMIAASEGDILCDDEIYRAARRQVTFAALPPIRVKGFAEPVAVFRPIGNPAGTAEFAVATLTVIRNRLDHLSPSEQLTLKVASVVGPTFTAAALGEIFPVDSERAHLDDICVGWRSRVCFFAAQEKGRIPLPVGSSTMPHTVRCCSCSDVTFIVGWPSGTSVPIAMTRRPTTRSWPIIGATVTSRRKLSSILKKPGGKPRRKVLSRRPSNSSEKALSWMRGRLFSARITTEVAPRTGKRPCRTRGRTPRARYVML